MKMAFSYKDCISKKLLKKVPPSTDKAERSIEKAKKWLKEAEKTHESKAYNSSVLASYMVMFHAARSILSLAEVAKRLGAKSHNAYARYEQGKSIPTIDQLNKLLSAVSPEKDFVIAESRAEYLHK